MSSWLAGKVSGLVKDVQRKSSHFTADDLAAELTQHARATNSVDGALELLSRWNEQIKSSTARFPLRAEEPAGSGGGEQLSFHLVLLRSQAFETLLDTCAKVPAVSAVLCAPNSENTLLGRALISIADQVLLPGSLRLWPTLLDALLDNDGSKAVSSWRPWARHVLTCMKRRWDEEALASATRTLDRQLGELTFSRSAAGDESSANADLQRQGAEGTLSKRGIRAALARSKLRRCTAESDSLRRRTDVLTDICERLRSTEGSVAASVPNLERLVADANAKIGTLDSGEEKLGADQVALGKDASDLGSEVEIQITGLMLTHDSFTKKRATLCEGREALMQKISEIDAQIVQLDEESSRCKTQVTQLRGQVERISKHYDSKTSGIVSAQRGVTDRKVRASSFRIMSEQALSVAQADAKRRDTELHAQLSRCARELRKTCTSYVHAERVRLNTATDCLDDSRMVMSAEPAGADEEAVDIGEDLAELMSITQGAWRSAQAVLQRVERVVEKCDPSESEHIGPACDISERVSNKSLEASTEEARQSFAREAMMCEGCVDCGTPIADWASVTCGVFLCVDCAGMHRGLGVHISFVRSTKMDKWSADQLQRMRLGGNMRFNKFLEGFPELYEQGSASSSKELSVRYASRAVAFYRQRLDAECAGRVFLAVPPPPKEGHLLAEACHWLQNTQKASAGAASGASVGQCSPPRPARTTSDSDLPAASLQEERAALEAVYLELQCRLRDALVPQ